MLPDLALPALLGVLLGVSAHRAGLCTVKAVAEIMITGRALVLWTFLKASFWTLGLLSVAPGLSTRPLGLLGLSGGLLFGIKAGLIPGGNDGLILFGIPSLSPHALPSWFGIVAGICLAFVTLRGVGARVPVIRCESDICRASL